LVDRPALAWLVDTDVGQLLGTHASRLRREVPVYVAAPPEQFGAVPSDDPMDQVMVRGRLDVLVPTPAGATIIDFKTDAVRPDEVPARAEHYRSQMDQYRRAVQTITGKPVAAAYLVFLAPRIVTRLP